MTFLNGSKAVAVIHTLLVPRMSSVARRTFPVVSLKPNEQTYDGTRKLIHVPFLDFVLGFSFDFK